METTMAVLGNNWRDAKNLLRRLDSEWMIKLEGVKRPALCLCAQRNYITPMRVLLRSGRSIDQSDSSGLTPLHYAARAGLVDSVAFLLRKRADVNRITLLDQTPLHLASQQTCLEVVEMLVEAGADVDCYDREKKTPLQYACNACHWTIAGYLVKNGADPNVVGHRGNFPLMLATSAVHCSASLVSDLLKAGARVDRRYWYNETPLHAIIYRAGSGAKSEIIRLLLAYGSDVNARTGFGHTPLHLAVLNDDRETALILVRAGCALDVECSRIDATPMSLAISEKKYRLVELLSAAGARILDDEWLKLKDELETEDPSMLRRLRACRVEEFPRLSVACRRAFLQHYGVEAQARIRDLPVPASVRRYLAFEDSGD